MQTYEVKENGFINSSSNAVCHIHDNTNTNSSRERTLSMVSTTSLANGPVSESRVLQPYRKSVGKSSLFSDETLEDDVFSKLMPRLI